eukprot:m.108618 g.108618  ORF g.108618 m.108618 type:complete len:101 (+) comp15930_c0_seq1:4584-4886(+)
MSPDEPVGQALVTLPPESVPGHVTPANNADGQPLSASPRAVPTTAAASTRVTSTKQACCRTGRRCLTSHREARAIRPCQPAPVASNMPAMHRRTQPDVAK